jgi:hypothetical protein
MKAVRTHTLGGRRYYIDLMDTPVIGWCDRPDEANKMWLHIQDGNTKRALSVAIHECLHAENFCEKHVDAQDANGKDAGDRIADLLWRLGWRRK